MKSSPSFLNRIFGVLSFLLMAAPSLAAFPSPQGRVNDFAGILNADAKTHLRNTIQQVESKTTAEIAVVTLLSLNGMTLEDFASGLFKQWGIGKKGKDNGILVLVCPPERKIRIEVGYGLEAIIPDGLSGSVIRNYFTPAFKKGDFAGGITAGVDQLAKLVLGNQPAPRENLPNWNPSDAQADFGEQIGLTAFLSLFVWIGFIFLGYGLSARFLFGFIFGSAFGGVPLLMMSLIPDLAGWPRGFILIEGAAAIILGLGLGFKYPKALLGKSGKSGGGWSSGSSSSSSSESSSSSNDSFGGGGSGGGGASGSW